MVQGGTSEDLRSGATGAIGKRLIPLLVASSHHVVAASRNPSKLDGLRNQGADPVIVDSLDKDAVIKAIESTRPDVIVHQTTAIASTLDLKRLDYEFALTNRLRTEGTEYLLAAARSAGVHKFLVQSYTGWPNERKGGRIKTEVDALDSNPPKAVTKTLAATSPESCSAMAASMDQATPKLTVSIVGRNGNATFSLIVPAAGRCQPRKSQPVVP